MGIKDYSNVASENTDVSGVAGTDIAENSPSSAYNNALRQVMADMANDLVIGGNFAWEVATGEALVRVGLNAPFDGSTVTFTMTALGDGSQVLVGNSTQVRLYIGGARQEPDTHYSAAQDTLSFFEAPLSSDVVFIFATPGTVTPAVEEYLLFEDDYEHMFVQADPDFTGTGEPDEIDLGLQLLEVNTP